MFMNFTQVVGVQLCCVVDTVVCCCVKLLALVDMEWLGHPLHE